MTEISRALTADEAVLQKLFKQYKQYEQRIDQYFGVCGDAGYLGLVSQWQMIGQEISEFKPTSALCCFIKLKFAAHFEQNIQEERPNPSVIALQSAVDAMGDYETELLKIA